MLRLALHEEGGEKLAADLNEIVYEAPGGRSPEALRMTKEKRPGLLMTEGLSTLAAGYEAAIASPDSCESP